MTLFSQGDLALFKQRDISTAELVRAAEARANGGLDLRTSDGLAAADAVRPGVEDMRTSDTVWTTTVDTTAALPDDKIAFAPGPIALCLKGPALGNYCSGRHPSSSTPPPPSLYPGLRGPSRDVQDVGGQCEEKEAELQDKKTGPGGSEQGVRLPDDSSQKAQEGSSPSQPGRRAAKEGPQNGH